MYLNKVLIVGNLTRDPELKALPSGMNVVNMGIATNRVYNDKDGNKQEQTEFHNVVVFGKQAETSAQYLKKGQSVMIEGRLQTRSWDQDGVKKYRTEIIADRVQFGLKSSNSGQDYQKDDSQDKSEDNSVDYPEEEINPDDIPF